MTSRSAMELGLIAESTPAGIPISMPTTMVATPTCSVFCNRWISSGPMSRLVSVD
ncbi:MAG: hypothetical protein OXC29_10055 [Rhodococcus sp.]|nr:hypothetical protein [Rhodococcus sp. (in: high G+C Gram-positive bacteria)]